jgi:hypothetical protein
VDCPKKNEAGDGVGSSLETRGKKIWWFPIFLSLRFRSVGRLTAPDWGLGIGLSGMKLGLRWAGRKEIDMCPFVPGSDSPSGFILSWSYMYNVPPSTPETPIGPPTLVDGWWDLTGIQGPEPPTGLWSAPNRRLYRLRAPTTHSLPAGRTVDFRLLRRHPGSIIAGLGAHVAQHSQ